MGETTRGALEEFCLAWLQAKQTPVRELEPGVYGVQLEGEAAERQLAFDPEAAAETTARELVTFGSPLLDLALAETLAAGRVLHLFAPPREADPASIEQKVRMQLGFDRVRCLGLGEGRVMEARVFRLEFVVTLHGDVVQQLPFTVHLDGASGRPTRGYEAVRPKLQEERSAVYPLDSEAPVSSIVEGAVRELASLSEERVRTLSEELRTQGERERSRIAAYFAQMEDELGSREARARTDESRRRAQESLAAARAERDMRLREADVRYRPRVEARLASVEVLHVPRYVAPLTLQRGSRTSSVVVRFELLPGVVSLPDCPSCRAAARLLVGTREGDQIGCEACVPRPAEQVTVPVSPSETVGVSRESSTPETPPRGRPGPPTGTDTAADQKARREYFEQILDDETLNLYTLGFLLAMRFGSRAVAPLLEHPRTLPARLLRDVVKECLGSWALPPLRTRVEQQGEGRVLGRGLAALVMDRLLPPEAVGKPLIEFLYQQTHARLKRLRAGQQVEVIESANPVLAPSPLGLRVPASDWYCAVMPLIVVAGERALELALEAPPGLELRVAAIVGRELGLTGSAGAVVGLGIASAGQRLDAGFMRVRDAFRRLSLTGGPHDTERVSNSLRAAFRLLEPARATRQRRRG